MPAFHRKSSFLLSTKRTGRPVFCAASAAGIATACGRDTFPPKPPPTRLHTAHKRLSKSAAVALVGRHDHCSTGSLQGAA